jgi:hypothetical protein
MTIASERTRELLIEVEEALKDSRLQEQVRDLRIQVDKAIEERKQQA